MQQKQDKRVELLFKQLQMLFKQLDKCVDSLQQDTENTWLIEPIPLRTQKSPIDERERLRAGINTIKNLLANGNISLSSMYDISEKIKRLSTSPYDLGIKTPHGNNASSHYKSNDGKKIKIKCKNIDNDLKSSKNTSLENLSNTLISGVRAIGRVMDKIVSILSKENYNDRGETPFALRVVGRPQFFQKPILSVGDGIKELEKVSCLLSEALLVSNPALGVDTATV